MIKLRRPRHIATFRSSWKVQHQDESGSPPSPATMQGGSSGIGYGLKYQASERFSDSVPQLLSPFLCHVGCVSSFLTAGRYFRLGASPTWRRTQITPASWPEPSAWRKRMRFVRRLIFDVILLLPIRSGDARSDRVGSGAFASADVRRYGARVRGTFLAPQRDMGPPVLSVWSARLLERLFFR